MRQTPGGREELSIVASLSGLLRQRRVKTLVLALLLITGTGLLLYRAPALPVGLHQDEVSEAYEAYSLLQTGADRWGYHLPVYFVSWGSGQNVMQAYMTVPVIALIGLNRLSVRFIPLLCGVLTLPLFYLVLRRWCGEAKALVGLFFLAFSPWHIMFSRFGIENSPLSFFMMLGLFLFGRALQERRAWEIVVCLVPFACALYTYGIVVVVVPLLLVLLCLLDLPSIRSRSTAWTGAFSLFGLLALPCAFFVFKNYITKRDYTFERWLPFSVPLVPITRLSQVSTEKTHSTVPLSNLSFLRHGLADGVSWFMVHNVPPIQRIVALFALLGFVLQIVQVLRHRRFAEPFLPAFLACVPLLVLVPLNISRGMPLFLPLLGLAGIGCTWAFSKLRSDVLFVAAAAVCATFFVVPTVRFLHSYYGSEYAEEVTPTYQPDFPAALDQVRQRAAPGEPIFITDTIAINSVQVLYFTRTPPADYQRTGATYMHPDFGPYLFSRGTLAAARRPLVYLIRQTDAPVCAAPEQVRPSGQFLVGECR
jgi:4-amino-4-deoxy-L-arabinose transferase-like glycosyltransferase